MSGSVSTLHLMARPGFLLTLGSSYAQQDPAIAIFSLIYSFPNLEITGQMIPLFGYSGPHSIHSSLTITIVSVGNEDGCAPSIPDRAFTDVLQTDEVFGS